MTTTALDVGGHQWTYRDSYARGSQWIDEPPCRFVDCGHAFATGVLLEARAAAQAKRELDLLVRQAPRRARRRIGDRVEDVVVWSEQGDQLIVANGEIVPVDGRLQSTGVFDESALTGESVPVERAPVTMSAAVSSTLEECRTD